ncbi:MAG: DUF448 domain-containing protein [Ghiorsea sp.]
MDAAQSKSAQRTCFCCRKTFEKTKLLRLVVDDEGQIWPDFSLKLPGRGAYLCMDEGCLKNLSDKRLQVLKRDFSPQLPQWQVLQARLSDMLALRVGQLMLGMKRRSAIGRDAVMHRMWDKEPLLVLFAADAGDALVRQVNDAVTKRAEGRVSSSVASKVLVSILDAQALGLALGREKVSVVAFLRNNPVKKFQQLCVWQQTLAQVSRTVNKREVS